MACPSFVLLSSFPNSRILIIVPDDVKNHRLESWQNKWVGLLRRNCNPRRDRLGNETRLPDSGDSRVPGHTVSLRCPASTLTLFSHLYSIPKPAVWTHTDGCLPAKSCANEIHITVGHWIHFRNGNWSNPPGDLLWVVGYVCPVSLAPPVVD